MERLTFDGLFCDIAMCSSTPGGSFCEDGPCSQRKVWERLKAYEDTGLAPDEIGPIVHFLKFYQSKFSPVQATELFAAGSDHLLDLHRAEKAGRLVVLPCKVGDTVYRKLTLTYQKETVTVIGIDNEGIYIGTTCGTYQKHHLGKTVFLTREEAEAALRKEDA